MNLISMRAISLRHMKQRLRREQIDHGTWLAAYTQMWSVLPYYYKLRFIAQEKSK